MVIKTVGKVYEAIDIFFGRLLRSRKSRRYDLSPPVHCLLDCVRLYGSGQRFGTQTVLVHIHGSFQLLRIDPAQI